MNRDEINIPPLPFRQLILMPWRWSRWVWLAGVLLTLVSYPLSLGPLHWLHSRGYIPQQMEVSISFFYIPLEAAVENLPQIASIMQDYCEWWREPPPPVFDETILAPTIE